MRMTEVTPAAFRREMLIAYSFPVGVFLLLPYLLALGFRGGDLLLGGLLYLLLLLAPVLLVGYVLAPWAGRRLDASKIPAFMTGALAALVPLLVLASTAALDGDPSTLPGIVLMWSLFALPASLLGTLLFIGACQRLRASGQG
jgi:hypothetical protein